jgi:hypothetical protein
MKKLILPLMAALSLSACETWETTNIDRNLRNLPVNEVQASQVVLTSAAYDPAHQTRLGDLKVSVNKTTAFHANPTVEQVEQKLREDAAKLGATKVVEAKISEVKISPFSWGSRDGTGIAVKASN